MITLVGHVFIDGVGVVCGSAFTTFTSVEVPTADRGAKPALIYILRGDGVIQSPDKDITVNAPQGSMVDFTSLVSFPKYWAHCVTNGGYAININPVPYTANISCEPLVGQGETTIVGGDGQCVIVCVEGTVTANDKEIQPYQFARVQNGKVVSVRVNQNGAALVIRRF